MSVSESAIVLGHVDPDCIVMGSAVVNGNMYQCSRAQDYAIIDGTLQGAAMVCGFGYVGSNAVVTENAGIFDHARVEGDAVVAGHTALRGYARVTSGVWHVAPLQIHGSRAILCVSSPNKVMIGTREFSLKYWFENYSRLFDDGEYFDYLLIAREWLKRFRKGCVLAP